MLLEFTDVKKYYVRGSEKVEALKGVSLTLDRGQIVSILGPSGSGKSTLFQLLGGLIRPTSGKICFDGHFIENDSDFELSLFRRRKLGFIFQDFNLLPALSSLENVALPLLLDGQSLRNVTPKAKNILIQLGIKSKLNCRPSELSGGEMQRVAIARALITDPLLILADEPTGSLDSHAGTTLLDMLTHFVKQRGQTLLMMTHDTKVASYGNRLIRLRDGRIDTDAVSGLTTAQAHKVLSHV